MLEIYNPTFDFFFHRERARASYARSHFSAEPQNWIWSPKKRLLGERKEKIEHFLGRPNKTNDGL
jgi:hypothetical protein